MAFKMKDSPFHNNGGKGKRGRRQKQPDSKEMSTDYNFMKQQFENFNPQTDTIFSSVGVNYDGGDMALRGIQREATSAKAKLQGQTTTQGGRTTTTFTGGAPMPKKRKALYAKSPSGKDVIVAYGLYDKKDIKGSPAQKRMGKFKDSDAPDAEGKFKNLSAPALASWLIKSRKGNLSRIISSLNQQIIFRRNKDPQYAAKMRKTQDIVRKRLGKDKK